MRIPSLLRLLPLAVPLAIGAPAAFAEGASFAKRLAAPATGEVKVSNVAGSIVIRTWDRNEIDVKARLHSGDEKVDVTQQGDRSVVEVIYPRSFFGDRGSVDLEVSVPVGSRVDVSAVSASIDAQGLRGESRLSSVSGRIDSNVPPAAFEVKSVSGGIALTGDRGKSDLRVSTVSGAAAVNGGAGRIDARTTSGRIDLDVDPADTVRARTTSGEIELRGRLARNGTIEMETVSGALSVHAMADDGFRYDVATLSGQIRNCMDKDAVRERRHGPGRSLEGTRGGGQGSVRLKSLSGSIDLCDR